MTTRQKHRNVIRQPVEEQVRQALQDIARGQATIQIEVHDHDGIRGGIINVDLNAQLSTEEFETLQGQLAASAKAVIPAEHPLATWTMVFLLRGQQTSMIGWFEA
jgi:hypothetical protein